MIRVVVTTIMIDDKNCGNNDNIDKFVDKL